MPTKDYRKWHEPMSETELQDLLCMLSTECADIKEALEKVLSKGAANIIRAKNNIDEYDALIDKCETTLAELKKQRTHAKDVYDSAKGQYAEAMSVLAGLLAVNI